MISPATPFAISPWSEAWNGQDSWDWVLTAPPVSPKATLQITASWWNCPVCDVTWEHVVEGAGS